MRLHLLLLAPALLLFARLAKAQEPFSPGGVNDAPTTQPAPARDDAPVVVPVAPGADEWWRPEAPPPRMRAQHPPNPMALRLDGAYAPRRLFSLGVTGADLGLALGIQTSHRVAWWAASRVSMGSTENGLSVWSGRGGAELEAVFDPIRFGVGVSFLVMGVGRAVREQTLLSYAMEARAFARVDCMRTDDLALFVRAGIDGAAEFKGNSAFWGPAIGAGVELGVRGKKRPEWAATGPPIPML